jgi:hypothetical protein
MFSANSKKDSNIMTKSDKLTKWIINLNPNKTIVIFGLLLPLYTIWLRKVGLFVIQKNGKNKLLFDILSLLLVLMIFSITIYGFIAKLNDFKINDTLNLVIPLTFFSIWFSCNGIASKNMIDFENRDNEYFFGFRKMPKYVYRFFHLFYFPFSIYWIQMEVNNYE